MSYPYGTLILLDFIDIFAHRSAMTNHPWDADASVFRYPPLSANDAGEPTVVFAGPLRECFQTVADSNEADRLNIEIETMDGEALYNGGDIERIIANGHYR